MQPASKSVRAKPVCQGHCHRVCWDPGWRGWPDNECLVLQMLHLKRLLRWHQAYCSCCVILPLHLRPSYIILLRLPRITLCSHLISRTSLYVRFSGIENDTSRSGFMVYVSGHSHAKLDPVAPLRLHIARTSSPRTGSGTAAVFLPLYPPYRALKAATYGHFFPKPSLWLVLVVNASPLSPSIRWVLRLLSTVGLALM